MRINLIVPTLPTLPTIEYGDVLIGADGIKVVVTKVPGAYPTVLIDLKTFEKYNAWSTPESLQRSGIIEDGNNIVRVIKSKNLEIRELGGN